jgi:hypothetical protein
MTKFIVHMTEKIFFDIMSLTCDLVYFLNCTLLKK